MTEQQNKKTKQIKQQDVQESVRYDSSQTFLTVESLKEAAKRKKNEKFTPSKKKG